MTFQLTTTQALKSLAGAAFFALSMDAATIASRHMSDVIWFALREVVGLLFWGVITGWQATHATLFGLDPSLLGCPLQLLHSLGSLAHLLGSAL
jgi:hypothetical protein